MMDKDKYEYPCPNPNCDGDLLFHFANIHPAPKSEGWALHICSKCIECGKVEHFEPAISDEERKELEEKWSGRQYYAWENAEENFDDETAEKIEKRMNELGYF